MKISTMELIRSYIKSTENEIAVDRLLLNSMPFSMPPLPRISKWMGKAKRWWSYYLIYISLMVAFLFGGFVFYSLLCGIYFFYKKINSCNNKVQHEIKLNTTYYFAFSELGYKQVVDYREQNKKNRVNDFIVITMPWVKKINTENDHTISLFDVISYFDLVRAFSFSLLTFIYYLVMPARIKWLLQTYTSPTWYLVALGMQKISSNLISSEHYDRWAVLTDIICNINNTPYILVQHGSLKGLKSKTYSKFNIPYRLTAVKELVITDTVELNLFLDNILMPGMSDKINVFYLKTSLNLSPIKVDKITVLFIGHPLCEKEHLKINSLLHEMSKNEFYTYYKEHPKARASIEIKKQNWYFVAEDNFFPDVNIVISYPSTLAYQYEELGKKIIFHDLNVISEFEINEIIFNVINFEVINEK